MPHGQQRKDTLGVKDAGRVGPAYSRKMREAMQRWVKEVGPGEYHVEGRCEPYYGVKPGAATPCHCGSHVWRDVDCIHMLAVRLYQEGIHPSAKEASR